MVLGVLVAVTLLLMVVAYFIHVGQPRDTDPTVQTITEARIQPVGSVYAGATGAAAQAAAEEAARAAAEAQVAFDGSLDGSTIYSGACAACHNSGAGGAPLLVAAAWQARIAQGTETLYRHAIEGFTGQDGLMPPKGGMPSLSDEQVIASVDYMLDNID